MSTLHDPFIKKLTGIIETNPANEQFGVSELAREMGISRSQIYRRLEKVTNKSVSQFIRGIRLERARELMKVGTLTSPEIE